MPIKRVPGRGILIGLKRKLIVAALHAAEKNRPARRLVLRCETMASLLLQSIMFMMEIYDPMDIDDDDENLAMDHNADPKLLIRAIRKKAKSIERTFNRFSFMEGA